MGMHHPTCKFQNQLLSLTLTTSNSHISFLLHRIINRRHSPSLLLLLLLPFCPRDKPARRHRSERCAWHIRTVWCHGHTGHWRTKTLIVGRLAFQHCRLDRRWRTIRIIIGGVLIPQGERSTAKRMMMCARARAWPRILESLSAKCKRSRRTPSL